MGSPSAVNHTVNSQLLERFYRGFLLAFAFVLCVGVPLFFLHQAASAALAVLALCVTAACWWLHRRGQAQLSLKIFAGATLAVFALLLFAGWPPVTSGIPIAVCLILGVVVG